jgi:DNA-binding transcriptional LysR family regulator
MQMKHLEESYSAILFDRSTRPPSLTRLGISLAEASRSVVKDYEDLSLLVRSDLPLSGKLSLGIATASIRLLPQLTQQLARCFPDLEVSIESSISVVLVDKVATGTLDAAILTPYALNTDLVATTINTESLVLVAAKAERKRLSLDLLQSHSFILFDPRTGIGKIVESFLAQRDSGVRKLIVLDSLEAIVELVALNMGVTIIPETEAARYGRNRVVWSTDLGCNLYRNLALVTRRSPGSLVLHEALVSAFRETLSSESKA